MSRFIKLVTNDFHNASRDKRELSVVKELQQEIIVVARGNNTIEQNENYTIHRRTSRPLGNCKMLRQINRLISIFTWAYYVRKLKADCISCHNWMALFIGWLSTWVMKNKPKLIYDAHEFEIGRNTDGKRGKFAQWLIPKAEKFLMKKCAFSMMVNDSIADAVQQIYKLDKRPLVVRNIPPYWELDEERCKIVRKEICDSLGIAENTFLIMYHGGVVYNRGIETLLKVVKADYNIACVILGNGEINYIKKLEAMTNELGISNRILFYQAVSIDVLKDYVGAVDCGMVTIPNACESYYYMLPNKFFENIQSETPVIGSEFPEIKRIIDKHEIGLYCDPEKIESIVECIEKLRTDGEMYRSIKNNLKVAKEELCWENEKKILKEAYRKILS